MAEVKTPETKNDLGSKSGTKIIKANFGRPFVFVVRDLPSPTWSLSETVERYPPLDWEEFFMIARSVTDHISKFLEKPEERGWMPGIDKVFRVFHMLSPKRLRAVFIGQDPYADMHEDGSTCRATGRAFSIESDDETPSSMRNILTELQACCPGVRILGPGNLIGWEQQGVLLLNVALTVRPGEYDSHRKIRLWDGFLILLLRYLAEKRPGLAYWMMGAKAQEFDSKIDPRGAKWASSHPSGQGFTSGSKPFRGCKIFAKINEHFIQKGEPPIDWTVY